MSNRLTSKLQIYNYLDKKDNRTFQQFKRLGLNYFQPLQFVSVPISPVKLDLNSALSGSFKFDSFKLGSVCFSLPES